MIRHLVKKTEHGLRSIPAAALAWPRSTLALFLGVFAALLVVLPNIQFELRLYDLEDPEFPSTLSLQRMEEVFADGNSILLLFRSQRDERPINEADLCILQDWLKGGEVSQHLEVKEIRSPLEIRRASREGDKLWYRHSVELNCGTASATSQRSIREIFSKLDKSPVDSLLLSPARDDLAVEIVFRDTQGVSRFGRFNPAPVGEVLELTRAFVQAKLPHLTVHMAGPSAFQWYLKEAMASDAYLNPLILILIAVFFRVFYGTWRAGLLYSVSLCMMSVLLYGSMSAWGSPIDILTTNLFLMTAITGVEDFLFLSHEYRKSITSIRPDGDFKRVVAEQAVPCFFTTVTTSVGFWSLCFSDIEMIQRFGFWAGVAGFLEWLAIFGFLPALVSVFPWLNRWIADEKSWSPQWLPKLAVATRLKWMRPVAIVLLGLGVWGFWNFNFNEHPTRNFPSGHDHRSSFEYLQKSRGWEGNVWVLFESASDSWRQPRSESLDLVLEEFRKDPNVAEVENPQKLRDWQTEGLTPDLSAMVTREISGTSVWRRYYAGNYLRVGVYFRSMELDRLRASISRLQEICGRENCEVTGQSVVYLDYSDHLVETLLGGFGISLLLVGIILILLVRARGLSNYTAVLLSAFWGPVVMMGFMAVIQVPISLVTSLFAAVIVGLTGDNAIQFIFGTEQDGSLKEGVGERAQASILLCLLLAVASLVFLFQSLIPMKWLGLLFFTGFTVNLIGDLWVLKAFTKDHD